MRAPDAGPPVEALARNPLVVAACRRSHTPSVVVPEDLQRALDAHPKAQAFFATLSSANRYAMLYRIQTVKRAETRVRKIEQFVAMLERHEVIHSLRGRACGRGRRSQPPRWAIDAVDPRE